MSAFDNITIDDLRRAGSVKWSRFPGTVGAFIAEMDFGTAPAVSEAIIEATRRGQFGYLPASFKADMATEFSGFADRRYGWSIDPADVRTLPDVLTALEVIIDEFTPPGSPIIVPTPAYMPFLTLPGRHDRPIVQVPMVPDGDRYVYDLDALAAAFTVPGQLFVLCNPHNPIGRVLSRAELLEIADVVEAKSGLVFSDEIHAPLTFAGAPHVPYAALTEATARHTITSTSTSKAWNIPGMKAAQLILSNDAHRARWNEVGDRVEESAATLGVIAAAAAYRDGEPWLTEVIDYLDGNRRALVDLVATHLPGVTYTPPEGTFLAWLDARGLGLPGEPADLALKIGKVATTSGAACGKSGFIRLNFATPRPILERAVTQIGAALNR